MDDRPEYAQTRLFPRADSVICGNFEKIAEYPGNHCGYCKIVRKDPNARALCKISDIKGCEECRKLKKLHIYECHAGLMEAVAPLT